MPQSMQWNSVAFGSGRLHMTQHFTPDVPLGGLAFGFAAGGGVPSSYADGGESEKTGVGERVVSIEGAACPFILAFFLL